MANDNIYIYDHSTGVEIVREMTDAEQTIRNAEIAANATKEQTKLAEAEAAQTARTALLAKLGITADEAKLLLS